jgi:hypothetical protein
VKKVLIILGAIAGVFILLVVGVVAIVFNATSALPETAERVFAAVRADDMATAHADLSVAFRSASDVDALRQTLAGKSLDDVVEASWSSRNIANDRGTLSGTATTGGGGTVPLTLEFVEEGGAWKIHSIITPGVGVQTGQPGTLPLPPPDERTALVKRSMHDFAVSLDDGNMEHFHASLSALWRKQASADELRKAFAGFFDNGIGLLGLDAMQPELDPSPSIDDNGVLELSGRYATTPSPVVFTHRYIFEGTDWRLIGINIEIP